MWLTRARELTDVESLELTPGGFVLRAPSLAQLDARLADGVRIAIDVRDGRIERLVDTPCSARAPVPEASIVDGRPQGPGWFVVTAADAPWLDGVFGAYTRFQGDVRFPDIGCNLAVLQPGQPICHYHAEADQEGFFVVGGEALLLVEGEERPLRRWDFVHCPPWTAHVIVGAGDGPCAVLAFGGRRGTGVVYPVDETALRHRAGVETEATSPDEAYAGLPDDEPAPFDPRWLP
jgi:uncharacterized cupin superfamily protein